METKLKWVAFIVGGPLLLLGSALIIINSNIWFYVGLVLFLFGWTLETTKN